MEKNDVGEMVEVSVSLEVLVEKVAERVVARMYESIERRVREQIDQAVNDMATDQLVARVKELSDAHITEALERPRAIRNQWGDKRGEQLSLAEFVAATAEKLMNETVKINTDDEGARYGSMELPRRDALVRAFTKTEITAKIKAVVDELKVTAEGNIKAMVEDATKHALAELLK